MKVLQLLETNINDTPLRFTDAGTDVDYKGEKYYSGVWEGLEHFEQRSIPAINEQTIVINDPDLSLVLSLLSGKWQWQELKVTWLVFDIAGNLEAEFIVLQGGITEHSCEEIDDVRSVVLKVQENHTLEQTLGYRTNSTSQHTVDPTDDCFELIPFLDGIKVPWGKEGNGIVRDTFVQAGPGGWKRSAKLSHE